MNEQFRDIEPYSVNVTYISDGLLRIIAIISLGALGESSKALLLDEIEDGINPSLAANLIRYLQEISQKSDKQIFVTTHSPIMLNYFDEDSIVFLWRNKRGRVWAQKMFDVPELAEHLSFMNPGELWLNMEPHELEEILEQYVAEKPLGGER